MVEISMKYKPTEPLVTAKVPMINMELLLDYGESHRNVVNRRLKEFKELKNAPQTRLFSELCFCILTPQSNALTCDEAMARLVENDLLFDPINHQDAIGILLRKVRFWKNKTRYIIRAWERFASDNGTGLKQELMEQSSRLNGNRELRNWFREEMRGMGVGMKEASHFLRNVGYGEEIAIIDRHVLRCLKDLDVISDADCKLRSETHYLELESLISEFSSDVGLPLEELDLLLWSARTGFVFK